MGSIKQFKTHLIISESSGWKSEHKANGSKYLMVGQIFYSIDWWYLLADANSTAFGSCWTQHSIDGDRQFITGLRFRVDRQITELVLAAVQITQPWVRRP